MHRKITRQSGLTLLELVVTLLVLTVLTSVAIRSVSGIQEQARFERSKRLLEQFRAAILGDGDWSSGVFGYAFDLATLPDNLHQLLENSTVWNPALAAVSYRPTPGSMPETVALGYGWRGSYLVTTSHPADPDALRDGFGGGLNSENDNTNYGFGYAFDAVSLTIQSYGADRTLGPSGYCGQDADYEEDCPLIIKRREYRFTLSSPVTVTLTPPNLGGTQNVFAAIFTRTPTAPNHLAAAFSTVSALVNQNGTPQSLSFSFGSPTLTAGPVLIGLFRCTSYTPCPPPDLSSFLSGQRIIYPDDHGLLRWQVRPQSDSFVVSW